MKRTAQQAGRETVKPDHQVGEQERKGMDERTLTALQGSIEKWKAIEAGAGLDDGGENCPLCKLFADSESENEDGDLLGCAGCPVRGRVNEEGCVGTPYMAWAHSRDDGELRPWLATTAEHKALARAEREFLESLLPDGSRP